MVYVSELQRKTLLLVDDLINKGKTYDEILTILQDKGYRLRIRVKNGYTPKGKVELCDKDFQYTFVDLVKRRNGLALWNSIGLF